MPRLYVAATVVATALVSFTCDRTTAQQEIASGKVIGRTCLNGLIIEVDPQYPIGRPVHGYVLRREYINFPERDSIVGHNAIAASNDTTFGLSKGARITFRYQPVDDIIARVCPGWSAPLQLPNYSLLIEKGQQK